MAVSKSRLTRTGSCLAIAFCLAAGALEAGPVELVSRSNPPADTASWPVSMAITEDAAVSADGRYIAFASPAVNLIPFQNDTSDDLDVFLHDRVAGTTVLVSHLPILGNLMSGGGTSHQPSISADGRWVAFVSTAQLSSTELDTPNSKDVFLYDRTNGVVTKVSSWDGTGPASSVLDSYAPVISADGNWIAFVSDRTHLVTGQSDVNDAPDVFLYDRAGDTTTLVSRAAGTTTTTADDFSESPTLSSDGLYLAFHSAASNLIAGQSGEEGLANAFLFDRVSGTPILVSRSDAAPLTGMGGIFPAVSADGAYVAFASWSTGLVPGQTDTNLSEDLFLYERASGTMTLVSRSHTSPTTTGQGGVSITEPPQVSADGRYIAFLSHATDAVSGQVNAGGFPNLLLFDRVGGGTTLVSHAAASATTASNGQNFLPSLSANGAWLAFMSSSNDLVAGQVDVTTLDIFLFERATGTNRLLSSAGGSATQTANSVSRFPKVSADGSVAVFLTLADDVVAGVNDPNRSDDLVLYDRAAGTNDIVTRHASGMASSSPEGQSYNPSVSADGRFVAFVSTATNLVPGVSHHTGVTDIFLFDRALGTTALVSHCTVQPFLGNCVTDPPVISADGNYVAFLSFGTHLIPGQVDGNGGKDVFLYDRVAGTTTLVSHAAGSPTTTGNGFCGSPPALSADGRWVAFVCAANNLAASTTDPNPTADVFLFDRVTGETVLVSHAAGAGTTAGNSWSADPVISADGGRIAFRSNATDLVAGPDANGGTDAYLYQRSTGAVSLVSRSAASATTAANGESGSPDLSADGRFVAFPSLATDLLPGQVDDTGTEDLFLSDALTGTTALASRHAAGAGMASGADLEAFDLSADGRYVAFSSKGGNLVAGLQDHHPAFPGGTFDVFVYDGFTRTVEAVSTRESVPTSTADDHSTWPRISAGGRFVAFSSMATDLMTLGGAIGRPGIFLRDRGRQRTERVSHSYLDPTSPGHGPSNAIAMNGDGTVVVFDSESGNLFPTDRNGRQDVFAHVWEQPAGLRFHTITPCRLLDTRETPPPPSDQPLHLLVHNRCGIPDWARAIAANVTVIPSAAGHLTAYSGPFAPFTSTINFTAGKTRANNAVLPLSDQGYVTFEAAVSGGGTVHLLVDVSGYFESPH